MDRRMEIMNDGIQKILLKLGEASCYFLCFCKVAGKTLDETVEAYIHVVNKGWMEPNCYIKCPQEICNYILGENYRYRYSVDLDPKADIIIAKYVRNGATHFVLLNKDGSLAFDSYGEESNIRKFGKLDSYRLFYKI
jgi:hypothetical protein